MSNEGVLQRVLLRLQANWRLKIALSGIIPLAFVGCYLFTQQVAVGPAHPVPQIGLDAWFPFWPDAVSLYESLWVLQGVAPWLMTDRRQFESYLRVLCMMTAAAMIFFVLWPTANPRPAVPGSANAIYRGLISVDSELNAFPSLHAAFAVYSALGCGLALAFLPRRRGLLAMTAIWVWTAGILTATLLTKQHAVLDLIAGIALGSGAHLFHRCSLRMPEQFQDAVAVGAGEPVRRRRGEFEA